MKSQVVFGLLVLFAAVTCNSTASAYDDRWYAGGAGAVRPYGAYGGYGAYGAYGGYGGLGGATTGLSNLVTAQGQRNVSNSEAAINYQQANLERTKVSSAMMDNRNKVMDDRLKRQQQAKQLDAAALEEEKQAEVKRKKFEAEHRPPPLASNQLDRTTGQINWPSLLKSPDFADLRGAVDTSFQTLATSGPSDDLSVQIKMQIGKLKDSLRTQITTLPLPEYCESTKFLDRLTNSVN